MGQQQSTSSRPALSPAIDFLPVLEELSHELALRFADKCFSHLEIAHFKDNFKTLADHQDGLEYWKEDTLRRFLCLPDSLQVGPILYQMATYIGAFPIPSLAPCILTREAMLKVVTIMTERYSHVLKRGKRDRVRLLFRSLAVFDRSQASFSDVEKPTMEQLVAEQKPDDMLPEQPSRVSGFAVDEPLNDDLDEKEDDDELALAALDSLDAIEVFREDQRVTKEKEKKIHQAKIPRESFQRLLVLLLLMAPLGPQESIARYAEDLSAERLKTYEEEAESILAAFDVDERKMDIGYSAFVRTISSSLPLLFDPLNALFEHFLFSKNINLSKHRDHSSTNPPTSPDTHPNPILITTTPDAPSLLTPSLLTHLSTFLVPSPISPPANLFHSSTRFHPIYSTATHGSSLTVFSRQVLSWKASSLLLVTGTAINPTHLEGKTFTIGLFLPYAWPTSSPTTSSPQSTSTNNPPLLFLLHPQHTLFPSSSPTGSAFSTATFSPQHGICIGCTLPAPGPKSSHSRAPVASPIPGPISLIIPPDLETASLHLSDAGSSASAFLPSQANSLSRLLPSQDGNTKTNSNTTEITIEISTLEILGLSIATKDENENENDKDGSKSGRGKDPLTAQKERLAFEDADAQRRANVDFGRDKQGARNLLEMAGLLEN